MQSAVRKRGRPYVNQPRKTGRGDKKGTGIMKREDLIKLGIAEDVVDKIMALHGSDIETHKGKLTATQAELDTFKIQLGDANKQIESFKGMDIEGVKKTADEYKAKFEAAQAEGAKQMAALKFDHALEGALTGAKAKNAKAVRALLDANALKLNDADGSIIGLDDQIKKIKEGNDYLFESETPTPRIVTGGQSQSILTDAVVAAARSGAGLPPVK
jgi:hypothetical protein